MILSDTKVTDQAYFQNRMGCDVVCFLSITEESGGAQGVVGMVVCDRLKVWSFELTHFHGLNVVSSKFVSGGKRTPLIGAYLPPSTMENLTDLEEDLSRFWYHYPIFLG